MTMTINDAMRQLPGDVGSKMQHYMNEMQHDGMNARYACEQARSVAGNMRMMADGVYGAAVALDDGQKAALRRCSEYFEGAIVANEERLRATR